MSEKRELIFIYNADSGILNATLDSLYKFFSTSNSCELCSITHGSFGMKKEWEKFIQSLDEPVRFFHKNEWQKEFIHQIKLPVVLLKKGDSFDTIVDSITLRNLNSKQLMSLIREKIAS